MKCKAVYFTAPGRVEVREEPLPALEVGQVLVETQFSAISAGTEMLVYRGQFPRELEDQHDTVSANLRYPLCYGYCSVGSILSLGPQVDPSWEDRLVFSFQPHTSHFVARADSLLGVPKSVSPEDAVFLPNMETAVNFVQDAQPILGEYVLVLGQGIVGLLTAGLLRRFPVERLVTADRYGARRSAALEIGVDASLDPTFDDFHDKAMDAIAPATEGYDLTLELSGNPSALDDAIALTRFSGRILIGSWYGEKRAAIDFGGRFHRSRIELISSQVSSISPRLSGRWDKTRRFNTAWSALQQLQPAKLITHRFRVDQAAEAYNLLDQAPEQALQVVFVYD